MQKRSVFILIFCLLVAIANAQQADRIVIKAGQLIDVKTGKVSHNVFITVEQGKITGVSNSQPSGGSLVDLSKYTVLPGFIDCHVHLLLNWKDLSVTQGLRMSSPMKALWGLHNLQTYLQAGFTTLRDAGEEDLAYGQLALRDAINSGLITGPRIFSSGNFISLTGGHGDADPLSPDQELPRRPNIANTVDEINDAVRHDLKYGADWIKLMATGGVMDPWSDYNVQELSDEQMARAVQVAHRAGKKVMAHAEGTVGIKAAARAGVDSVEHGTMMDEEGAEVMAKNGTFLVPTLYTFQEVMQYDQAYQGMDPVSFQKGKTILQFQQPAFERALKHHLKIAFGDDNDPDKVHKEFAALVRGGMKPLEALQAATVNAAELLGASSMIGSIEAGKSADIVALDGEPLQDISNTAHVVFVMKGGAIFRHP
jgi:imidazolonepropionase-like amidohydrolase